MLSTCDVNNVNLLYIYFLYGPFIDFTNHLFCFTSVNICIYIRTPGTYVYSEFVVKPLCTFKEVFFLIMKIVDGIKKTLGNLDSTPFFTKTRKCKM